MRIGTIPGRGEAFPLRKWIIGIEILRCPPHYVGTFRPYILVVCMKVIEPSEHWKVDGKPGKKYGGWWRWASPIGIHVEISRYR